MTTTRPATMRSIEVCTCPPSCCAERESAPRGGDGTAISSFLPLVIRKQRIAALFGRGKGPPPYTSTDRAQSLSQSATRPRKTRQINGWYAYCRVRCTPVPFFLLRACGPLRCSRIHPHWRCRCSPLRAAPCKTFAHGRWPLYGKPLLGARDSLATAAPAARGKHLTGVVGATPLRTGPRWGFALGSSITPSPRCQITRRLRPALRHYAWALSLLGICQGVAHSATLGSGTGRQSVRMEVYTKAS